MGLSALDTTIVLAYLAGIFVLAQWVSREKGGHQKSAKDYFLASKALPWWAVGASLNMTCIWPPSRSVMAGALPL